MDLNNRLRKLNYVEIVDIINNIHSNNSNIEQIRNKLYNIEITPNQIDFLKHNVLFLYDKNIY